MQHSIGSGKVVTKPMPGAPEPLEYSPDTNNNNTSKEINERK